MKRPLHRLTALLALLALLGLATGFTNQLPLDKKIQPGISVLTYAGQSLRFNTPAPLTVRFETIATGLIKVEFVGSTGAPAGAHIHIYWVNVGTDVYDGVIPLGLPEDVVLNTEGGFVDR